MELLAHALRDDQRAVALHQLFKDKVICRLPREGFQLSAEEVCRSAAVLEAEHAAWLVL